MLSRLHARILCVPLLLPAFLSAQNTGPTLQLFETVPDKRSDSGWQVALGSIRLMVPGQYMATFSWSGPPASMDAAGTTVSLNVAAQGLAARINAGIGVSGYGFDIESGSAEALAEPGKANSRAAQARIRPKPGLSDGQVLELRIGAAYGPGVTYRYRASIKSPATMGDANRRLAATMDCPPSIVISALPSLNCHIMISGWRRNTAEPVQVIFPDELDTFGNHTNGIQLIGRGSQNVFNWDEPRYSWGLFVFACPGQQGTGANCYGNVATPEPKTVRIIVRQGTVDVEVPLVINALARGGNNPTGPTGGATGFTGGPGQLAARIDCPGSIVISALPSLNCHIIISGWRRNTADPVEVLFPEELDTFGNHRNGIQLIGRGSENVFNWDGPTRSWGLFVFACPGQQGTGANCYGNTATPEPKTVPIIVRQRPNQIQIALRINALARPGSTSTGTGASTSALSAQTDVNRPGYDYQNFDVTSADECRAACANDPRCRAFTFVKPGFQGRTGRCWLKAGVPPGTPDKCCISGVKTGPGMVGAGQNQPISGNWTATDGAQVAIIVYNDGSVTIRYTHPTGYTGVVSGRWDGSTFTGNYETRTNAGVVTGRGEQTLAIKDGRLEGPWVSTDGRRGTWVLQRR